ncbi:prepilin-type N-terminal cleavage/methylation domain-containing protein [Solibacillus sp. FSL W7-1436]|uniref:pilus assembly FimT family protein n=1 Tax=Solibacillus sp. FSL W7-1436 TaxID=2921705 RepID=UPI0030FAE74C
MFKTLKKRIKNEKGLSLVELLAVIVILGIISAIAVPAIGSIIENTRDKAILSDAAGLLAGAKIAIADGSCGVAAGTDGIITCDNDILGDVFEGTLAANDQVTYNTTSKVYTITYGELGNIKNTDKFPVTGTTISSSELTTLMGQ